MLRRFSGRREAVAESIAAKSLGRAMPIHNMNVGPVFAGHAAPLVSGPMGTFRYGRKTRAVKAAARKPADPRSGGELL
jgi:hypothetical protein